MTQSENTRQPQPAKLNLKCVKLAPEATLPVYATAGAACFDLHALESAGQLEGPGPKQNTLVVRTGLAFQVPEGHVMLVYSRSGHGFKSGVRLANCVGVIDSDYRGEVMVKLSMDEAGSLEVNAGDRIAQAMIVPLPAVQIIEVSDLDETERGTGGFGSTGA